MPTREDIAVAAEALKLRLVSQLQVHRATRAVDRSHTDGCPRVMSEVLLAQGDLRADDVKDLLDRLGLRVLACADCGAQAYVSSGRAASPPRCPYCQMGQRHAAEGPSGSPERRSRNTSDSLVGREVVPFRFLRVIARDDTGTTYRAENMVAVRPCVVKILNRPSLEEARVRRFLRAAKAAGRLRHPNILRTYGAGPFEGTFYLETEYAAGRTLRRVIQRLGRVGPHEASGIAARILEALSAAHAQGVVHRSLAPESVLLTWQGGVKLKDFCLLKDLLDTEGLTRPAQVLGSPWTLSPEQCDGRKVDGRADLYALGLTLYEMLTGERAFDSEDPLAVLEMHRTVPLPDPRERVRDLPAALVGFVFRLSAKDPEQRFPDAAHALDALRALWKEGLLHAASLEGLMAAYRAAKRRRLRGK